MEKRFIGILLFALIISILVFLPPSNCNEDAEEVRKRVKFYAKISEISNNTIIVGASSSKGLSCVANDDIEYGSKIMQVSREMSLNPYDLFPFKYEFVNFLQEIPRINNTLGQEQKFSVFLLTYYLLYYMYAPKEAIRNYIIQNKMEQYYDVATVDESLKESFPKIMLNSATLENEHYALLNKLRFPISKGEELDYVYKSVLGKIYSNEHMTIILPWISDFKKFRWAYSIVMSRGMTLRLHEYYVLDQTKNRKLKNWEKKNLKVNQMIGKSVGAPCVIAFVDLCNHYQPKHLDLRDRRPIILDTIPNYFLNTVSKNYYSGEEVTYTYINDPTNMMLFLHYGFIIPNNIFNMIKLKYYHTHPSLFTQRHLDLCLELGCTEGAIKDPSQIPSVRYSFIKINSLDTTISNYARVKYLNNDFDSKSVLKTILNNIPVSFENEIKAWLYYFNNLISLLQEENVSSFKTILKIQKYRDLLRRLESNWQDDEDQRDQWRNLKTYENIYSMDLSYKKIMTLHLKGSINQIIYHTNNELKSLKNTYLSTSKS